MKPFLATLLLLCSLYAEAEDVLTASFPGDLDDIEVSLCFDGSA